MTAAVLLACLTPSAVADPLTGGSCNGASRWVVCTADDDSAASGSRPRAENTGKGRPGKPVCTVKKVPTQPPEGSALWEGKSAGDGAAVYQRTCRNGPGGTPVYSSFVADAGNPVPAIDPRVVAQQAVSRMKLSGPKIASPRPAGKYVVGVPTWMWVEKGPSTFGPATTSATAGGVTVTATAVVTRIVWDMGDGAQVACAGPGTVYAASYGRQESPTCGHTYTRTSASGGGGKFTVTATATWSVQWQVNGGGEAGQFTETRQSQEQVAIGELQVVR
ncbi:ATP/GTP-binding protein [Streptomyces sp. NPDC015184]|uniref:ATP/GTP-binding protein n=1 Tax=Streptomyces sp. NPDC015184 TaxID=3364946 RepID=UPI0036F7F607